MGPILHRSIQGLGGWGIRMCASSLQLAPCVGCAGGRLEFHWPSWLWHWRVGTKMSVYGGIHQGILQCQFQQMCVHVSRRTPSLVIRSSWHFCGWKLIIHCCSHSWMASRPTWSLSASACDLISLWMRQSSANSRVWDEVTHWGKSFMYTRNNNGPSTVPWGTPDVTGLVSDELPSRTTVWSRWERKDLIHMRVNPSIPIAWSFRRRRWWATLSNAFAKSKRIASVWVLLSQDFRKSLDDSRSCVSQERLFLKPCWASVRMSFLSRCRMTCELMICSITLQHIEVSDTGR